MMKKFESVAANEKNPKWENMIKREEALYNDSNDIRTYFERDYTRILHSDAYKRLKHKTQVFFSPESDHICTRIEHVNYVESVSYTIASHLGLNTELTRAISIGHDIGHSPFGHKGESILSTISKQYIGEPFWHEKNGLYMADKIELLYDREGYKRNLNLCYATRDGIIAHCGEIDENSIKPRDEVIDLEKYNYPNEYAPYTWEGCVVKVADKISYIGRDIEDAIDIGFIDKDLKDLHEIVGIQLSNSSIMNTLILDVCENSTVEKGLSFSDKTLKLMENIKRYNYKNIYNSDRMKPANEYFNIVINQIFSILKNTYDGKNTIKELEKVKKYYPKFITGFEDWISKYWNLGQRQGLKNKILYDANNEKDYYKAIITFISGMTDNFAIDVYNEIIRF